MVRAQADDWILILVVGFAVATVAVTVAALVLALVERIWWEWRRRR